MIAFHHFPASTGPSPSQADIRAEIPDPVPRPNEAPGRLPAETPEPHEPPGFEPSHRREPTSVPVIEPDTIPALPHPKTPPLPPDII
jgi:hypothetical protein